MIRKLFILAGVFVWGNMNLPLAYASPKNSPNVYDSTTNFLGPDITKYIGQELFLTQKPGNDREFGWTGFYTKPESKDENVYKPNDKYYTSYNAIAGKYFKVLDAVCHPDAAKGEYLVGGKCFLKIQLKDSNDVIYYEYNSNNEYSFPFIIKGFYEKQKKAFVGGYFVYSDTVLKALANRTDVATGKPVTFRTGETWKCTDVQMPEAGHTLMIIIQNNLGEKTSIPFGARFYSLVEVLNYKKKFGIPTFNRLLKGDLFPGMTQEMVKISIGEPYEVNAKLTNGTNRKKDEWKYYSGKTLFFDNGILIEMKDTPAN